MRGLAVLTVLSYCLSLVDDRWTDGDLSADCSLGLALAPVAEISSYLYGCFGLVIRQFKLSSLLPGLGSSDSCVLCLLCM